MHKLHLRVRRKELTEISKVIETEVKVWTDLSASILSVNTYLSHNPDNGLLQEIRKALKLDEEVKGDYLQEAMSHQQAKEKMQSLS